MNKLYLLVLFFIPLFSVGQSLTILNEDDVDKTNSTITVTSYNLNNEHVVELFVKNSGSSKNIAGSRYELQFIEGSKEYWCWDVCYLPSDAGSRSVWDALMPVSLGSNQSNLLSAHVMPQGNSGTAVYRFHVYDQNNPSDSANVTIEFNFVDTTEVVNVEDVVELKYNDRETSANVYPNPATNYIKLSYHLKDFEKSESKFIVRDILGETVKTIPLDKADDVLDIRLETLKSGVYFYSLVRNEKAISTRRLIIQ